MVRTRFSLGDAFFQAISHTGLATYLTMQVAEVELAGGDRRALDRLAWLLDAATPTWTWPEAIHPPARRRVHGRRPPRLGGGRASSRSCATCSCARCPRRRRDAVPALALCSLLPDSWLGQGFEVHDAPTHFGSMSYAVRWHGARPALLWELTPHDGVDDVRLTAPGLDPDLVDARNGAGEALLAAPERGALSG